MNACVSIWRGCVCVCAHNNSVGDTVCVYVWECPWQFLAGLKGFSLDTVYRGSC